MGRFIKYIGSPCSAMRRALSLLNQNNTPIYVPKLGDIIVHNSTTNEDKIVPYEEWLQLEDSWDITGLYGINTYEEETAEDGDYIIMSNGTTLIIDPDDYSKVSDNWEQVDTILKSSTYDYVEIGGIKWATMNIGANSITDTGLYFQWGDTQGYTADQVGEGEGQKYFGWADYKYWTGDTGSGSSGMTKYNETDGKTVIDASDDAVIANWGGQWRMPTTEEYAALGNAVTTAWTTNYLESGIAGLVCTDKTDSSKVLFFPACGSCSNGSVNYVGSHGFYWSSLLNSSNVQKAYNLLFLDVYVGWQSLSDCCGGFPVRGVLDE